jgi:hypothetical protein
MVQQYQQPHHPKVTTQASGAGSASLLVDGMILMQQKTPPSSTDSSVVLHERCEYILTEQSAMNPSSLLLEAEAVRESEEAAVRLFYQSAKLQAAKSRDQHSNSRYVGAASSRDVVNMSSVIIPPT